MMQFYVLHLTLRNFSIDTMREADFNEALVGCDNLSASVECENISQVVPSHNVTEIKINIEGNNFLAALRSRSSNCGNKLCSLRLSQSFTLN